ncbi:solute carrier family 25 member 45 [Whalleya microplaca]|nr:solute carrier family 25 member 45 [Whalleya microplaca]
MSADFWAGYLSGAVGILIGNPLDLLKVRLQAQAQASTHLSPSSTTIPPRSPILSSITTTTTSYLQQLRHRKSALVAGTAAPVLGYGALNAVLFVSYNRSAAALSACLPPPFSSSPSSNSPDSPNSPSSPTVNTPPIPTLTTTWLAGAIAGLATWSISAPTELIKCRAQTAAPPISSAALARRVLAAEGVRGLYVGGAVTALRDSVGYGFYFWAYELGRRWMEGGYGSGSGSGSGGERGQGREQGKETNETVEVLLCGGIAGVVTWASVFPLDVVKTRVQTQTQVGGGKRLGAVEVAREAYREGGVRVFFRGLTVCSVRAFVVNAVQWAAYEWIMLELGQGRNRNLEPV